MSYLYDIVERVHMIIFTSRAIRPQDLTVAFRGDVYVSISPINRWRIDCQVV